MVKIDRSFVNVINDSATSSAVARSIITLAETLHLEVVAEGIETVVQQHELVRLGCLRGQGFLMAKPMTPAHFEQMALTRGRPMSPAATA
jgi:EAL domain-containing protein (putative c-di-GMP-specific phosphodiesterase class I)